MTEYNIFCFSYNYSAKDSFQKEGYRAFNQVVGPKRYAEIAREVNEILDRPELQLDDFWKQVTQDQWNKLLAIPEARNFKEGFEFISGVKINDKKKITIEGKDIYISTESLEELKKQLLQGH